MEDPNFWPTGEDDEDLYEAAMHFVPEFWREFYDDVPKMVDNLLSVMFSPSEKMEEEVEEDEMQASDDPAAGVGGGLPFRDEDMY